MRPDPGIIREFVWRPISEFARPLVFAFGAPWFPLLTEQLRLPVIDRLGAGGRPYGSRVASRSVVVMRSEDGAIVVAEKHAGSATPPSDDEVALLRQEILALAR